MVHDTEYTKSPKCRNPFSSVLLPAPDGAEMRNKIPVLRVSKRERSGVFTALFDVLNLLADFLQLGFCCDDPM